MPYTAIHDTPPYYGNLPAQTIPRYPSTPRYGSPDIDPSVNIYTKMSDGSDGSDQYNGHQYQQQTYQAHSNGVSSSQAASSAPAFQPRSSRTQGESRHSAEAGQTNSAEGSRKRPRPEDEDRSHAHQAPMPSGSRFIHGSFFGMTARNPVTREIGDFLLNNCKGRNDVEVEIKLGQISTPVEIGQRWKRISLPALTELILPDDFKVGPFRSDMTKPQHFALNRLLNDAVVNSDPSRFRPDPTNPASHPPHRIKFFRVKQIDTFYNSPGNSKTRVSRDRDTGEVLACIKKKKIADLNVANGREALDFRVSVSTEEPCEMPTGQGIMSREKDRACYRHQLVQVDLTYVKSMGTGTPNESYELELEVVDVPALIAEGMKEERGEPNQYDEMVTSILDSARILIRNLPPELHGPR